jgi:DpnII restriction endonuclease
MRFIKQTKKEILESLSALTVEWRDDVARRVIDHIEQIPIKATYDRDDIKEIFSGDFEDGKLICRLFLKLSKDSFTAVLKEGLGKGGLGIQRYTKEQDKYIDALVTLGLLDAMADHTNGEPKWSDVLVERLRSGRGSAISGQKRGRGLEDVVEDIIKDIYTDYETRCKFVGMRDQRAKCDFAIPSKKNPCILIEVKGYGATGSKMSDVVGDMDAIITAKRPDTKLLLFTDGLTWTQRQSDLSSLVDRQNNGLITMIYTTKMKQQFEADLTTLKGEYGL